MLFVGDIVNYKQIYDEDFTWWKPSQKTKIKYIKYRLLWVKVGQERNMKN